MKDPSKAPDQTDDHNLKPQTDQGARPDIELSDGPRRLAIWLNENEYGFNPKASLNNAYRTSDGEWVPTSLISSKDLLPFAKLFERANEAILQRRQQRSQAISQSKQDEQKPVTESNDWHDDAQRRDEIKRERFKDDRKASRGTRRSKLRDRTAR